jgi:malic enzyme
LRLAPDTTACVIGAGSSGIAAAKAMLRDMQRERERMFKRYVVSKRHTMQVDFDDYLLDLEREQRRGRKRARRLARNGAQRSQRAGLRGGEVVEAGADSASG